jgi:integrase/recombinase XerD
MGAKTRYPRRSARNTGRVVRGALAESVEVSQHTLRHGFVTLSHETGSPLTDVQDAAGHADPRTTRRYDRARHRLDAAPTYALAAALAE